MSDASAEEMHRRSFASSRTGGGCDACLVCMERPPDAVLLECGHGGICAACAARLWERDRRCPLCREGFAGVVRLDGPPPPVGGQVQSEPGMQSIMISMTKTITMVMTMVMTTIRISIKIRIMVVFK